MKKILISLFTLASILFLACSNNSGAKEESRDSDKASQENKIKRYNVKSGIVKYKINIQGKVMGSEVSGSGKKELYFKDWGAKELKKEDSKQVTKINVFGHKKTEVNEVHSIDKFDNGKSYTVDTKNKIIYLRRDPAMEMVKNFNNGDAEEVGEKMLESIGGKKIGTGKVQSYTCDIWEIPGGKQWIYKGIPLKIDMNVMGIHTVQEATEAKFNTDVPDKYFELPNYPIQKEESYLSDKEYEAENQEMRKNAKQMAKMSYEDYKKMLKQNDPEASQMSEQEIRASYKMMKNMAKMMDR